MSWRQRVAFACLCCSPCLFADDRSLWREFGLVDTQTTQQEPRTVTSYRMKDLTGALAAWQWQRTPADHACQLSAFCAQDPQRLLVTEDNYLLIISGPAPSKEQLAALLHSLPNKRDSSLPAILTFVPRQGLVANSSRYVLGPESMRAFVPEMGDSKPGFEEGAEAQVAQYDVANNARARLVLFNYATPEMARLHSIEFRTLPNVRLKRSGVLVALVLGAANDAQADSLLSRIEYEARITWNDAPPPGPIKPLYRLLMNIMYMSIALSALALFAGLIYAGMRIYRRRYGNLESQEAMTTLHLTGE